MNMIRHIILPEKFHTFDTKEKVVANKYLEWKLCVWNDDKLGSTNDWAWPITKKCSHKTGTSLIHSFELFLLARIWLIEWNVFLNQFRSFPLNDPLVTFWPALTQFHLYALWERSIDLLFASHQKHFALENCSPHYSIFEGISKKNNYCWIAFINAMQPYVTKKTIKYIYTNSI